MNVIFLTQNEPFYIPYYIESILEKISKNKNSTIWVYSVSANLPKKTFLQTVCYHLSFFGFTVFLYLVILRIFYWFSDILKSLLSIKGKYHSVKLVCRKYGITYAPTNNINSS